MTQPSPTGSSPVRPEAPWEVDNLLEVDFRHSDPERLENLLDEVPKTDEVPIIEFQYDTRNTGVGQVRCRHCRPSKSTANHNRGFVLRYADGSRVLFGKDCGAKEFGQVFVDQEKRFQAARQLQDLLKRKRHIQQNRAEAEACIEQLEGYPGWKVYCDTKWAFKAAFWFVVTELGTVAQRRGGRLTRVERVRDHAAEAKQDMKGKKRPRPIYRDMEIDMGTLAGLSFFEAGPLPDKTLPDLFRQLKSALWTLDDKDKSSDLALTFRGIEGLVEEIERLAGIVGQCAAAVAKPNIDLLMRWMTESGYGNYRYEGSRLYRHDVAGNVVAVKKGGPEDWRDPVRAEAHLVVPPPLPAHLFTEVRALLRP